MKLVSFFSGRTLRTTTVAQALEECGKIPPPLLAVEGMLPANATTTSGLRQRRLRGLELPSITNHQTLIPRSSVTAGQAHQQPLLSLISLTIRWVIKVTRKLSSYKGLKAHAVEWSEVLGVFSIQMFPKKTKKQCNFFLIIGPPWMRQITDGHGPDGSLPVSYSAIIRCAY